MAPSDTERRGAELGGERFVPADIDSGCPLATGTEQRQLAGIAGEDETGPGAALFVGPSRRGDHDRGRYLLRHPPGPDACPQGISQLWRKGTWLPSVSGTTYVLDMDEELDRVHRPVEGTEERGRPSPYCFDESLPGRAIPHRPPHLVRISGQWWPDEPGAAIGSTFTDNEVRG
jgi:hypothetical protein